MTWKQSAFVLIITTANFYAGWFLALKSGEDCRRCAWRLTRNKWIFKIGGFVAKIVPKWANHVMGVSAGFLYIDAQREVTKNARTKKSFMSRMRNRKPGNR